MVKPVSTFDASAIAKAFGVPVDSLEEAKP
jgi:hypothetical protein